MLPNMRYLWLPPTTCSRHNQNFASDGRTSWWSFIKLPMSIEWSVQCINNTNTFCSSMIMTMSSEYVAQYLRRLGSNNSLFALDKRVTFWLQCVRSLPCGCAYAALFARRLTYNHQVLVHAPGNTHAQGSDRACWSWKVTLSSKAIGL